MEAYARKLSVRLNIDDLKEEKIVQLKDLIGLHQGDRHLNFVIYDTREQIKLNMSSRKQKVKISQELLYALEEQDINYKLN